MIVSHHPWWRDMTLSRHNISEENALLALRFEVYDLMMTGMATRQFRPHSRHHFRVTVHKNNLLSLAQRLVVVDSITGSSPSISDIGKFPLALLHIIFRFRQCLHQLSIFLTRRSTSM